MLVLFAMANAAAFENPGFEEGAAGEAPPKWTLGSGARAEVRIDAPYEGIHSVRLSRGALSQSLSISELAGRRILVSLRLKPSGSAVGAVELVLQGPNGRLWHDVIEVWREGWQDVQMLVDVPASAHIDLELRALVRAGGHLDIDSARLEDMGAAGDGDAPPAPLDPAAADRMAAFTRLYGAVRWFHPSDQSLEADWDAIAVRGVQLAEEESDPAVLAAAWEELLQPAAPALQLWTGDAPPAPSPDEGDRSLAWHHLGAGVLNAPGDPIGLNRQHTLGGSYRRFRIDDGDAWRSEAERSVELVRVDARPWRDETVRLLVDGQPEGGLEARVVLSVDGGPRAETPAISGSPAELLLKIPANAEDMSVSLRLKGQGDLKLDALGLEPVRTGPGRRIAAASGALGLQGLLLGALGIAGTLAARRTVGGLVIVVAGLVALSQVSGLDPVLAWSLPLMHMDNLGAHWMKDAAKLAEIQEAMGGAVPAGWSLLVFSGWIAGLVALSALLLRNMDIRGGGD